MNKWYVLSAVVLCIMAAGCRDEEISDGGSNGTGSSETVAGDLTIPWAIDFLPDGTMLFTERPGAVKMKSGDSIITIGRINVAHTGEAGLLGIAVDPDFVTDSIVYLYYTYGNNGLYNRVSAFALRDSIFGERVLLDSIPGAMYHDGGRIKFGPDGMLYVTTGDAQEPSRSGDTGSLAGKILRMEKSGAVPADNPFNNYVYALGLRNPQGLAWHNDTLYASDHGPQRYDEINRIVKGADYGWPRTCDTEPAFRCYTDFTIAPSGIAIVGDRLYVACLRGEQVRRIDLSSSNEEELFTGFGRVRDVVLHQNSLYIATNNKDGRGRPGDSDDRILLINP
jgi:aldose sugar dehydrogenase